MFSFGMALPASLILKNSKNMMSYANFDLCYGEGNADYGQVLTSFAVAESCFRKQESGFKRKGHIVKESSPLHQIKWNRIVVCFISDTLRNGANFACMYRGFSLTKPTTSRNAPLILPKLVLSWIVIISGVCRAPRYRIVLESFTA